MTIPLWRQALYLLLPWFGFALALEGATRLVYDAGEPPRPLNPGLAMCEPDPNRIWRYKPSYTQHLRAEEYEISISTNSWGLRDRETSVDEDALRILVVGDSFTFGWGVEAGDRYSEVLAGLLADGGLHVQVLNAGHWSYSFDQQLLLLRELLPRFRPHVVLQGVYPGHVLSIDQHEWTRAGDGSIRSIGFRSWANILKIDRDGALVRTNWLIDDPPLHSRFISKLARRYYRWRQIEAEAASTVDLYVPGTKLDGAWAKATEAIGQSSRVLAEHGASHIVFSVPHDVSVHESERPEYFLLNAGGQSLDMEAPYRKFARAAAGSTWVDLRPTFIRAYTPALYFPRDPHWTAAGHRLAAESLLPFVLDAIRARAGRPQTRSRDERQPMM